MRARPGDEIIVRSHHVGQPAREGEIVEVRGENGGPPYVVRWDADGHEGLFYPGPDAEVKSTRRRRRR
jgi:hypothetical protein